MEQGRYYRESKDAAPYVAEVTVTPCGSNWVPPPCPYVMPLPSDCPSGYGKEDCDSWYAGAVAYYNERCEEWLAAQVSGQAVIEASIEEDPYSPEFGQIKTLTVIKGGLGFLAWRWTERCHQRMNGSWVLRANTPTELVSVSPITACYGSGACGRVVPLGDRLMPTVCIYGGGTGGTITATLSDREYAEPEDNPWKPYWRIASVTASGGSGYTNGSSATITYSGGATIAVPARVTLHATPITGDPPTGGSLTGATIEYDTGENQEKGGKFYIQKQYLGTPGAIREVEIENAGSGYAKKGRVEPTVSVSASTGSGATFTPTLAIDQDDCGVDYWYISSVSVSGGTEYLGGSSLTFSVDGAGTEEEAAEGTLVLSEDPELDGVPVGVDVSNGGRYYEEDEKEPPYVAEVTVEVTQIPPSVGFGAKLEAIVEDDPAKSTFGQITKLTITDGGSNYSLWGGPKDCEYHGPCGITLTFRGTNKEPEVEYDSAVFRAKDPVVDCNNIPSQMNVLHGINSSAVATISEKGIWNPDRRCMCDPDPDPTGNCTPVPPPISSTCRRTPSSGTTVPCPPCRGPCSQCEPCAPGCYCHNGDCAPCEGSCDEESPCPDGCVCVDGECVGVPPGTTSACCVCTDGWVNRFIGDMTWDTEEEAVAWNGVLAGITAAATASLEANGYDCIFSNPPRPPFLDESLDPPKWYNPGQGFHGGTCCGVIDYDGIPASDGDSDTIYPCIQDDVTRDCVEGLTAAQCDARCNGVFHAAGSCDDEDRCNPLP
jgi:hypothetical protein